ncbi:hypothetical protein [Fulvivirga lutea]|uniref:Uncharacterized protein n=1 Tax=Fulvivirga lutea TaxID=2810512 RepID=A0A975A0X8_9BACT|nr:hypothetical protein [Fulvivirga lutea]QSE97839.1 hypothetical protein JR347_01750 [Fulvivirga lutea]
MQNSYNIIWKHFNKNSYTGIHLRAKEDFSLPYFVDGEEKEKFEKKEPTALNPFHLVKGLLVGYFDKPPATDTSFAKAQAKKIITEQLPTFKSPSLESLVLDLSAYLRDTHGQQASLQSLMAGIELAPESSAIKYDCCLDLINCIEDDEIEDRIAGIQKLKILLSEINIKDLAPELAEDYKQMVEIAEGV